MARSAAVAATLLAVVALSAAADGDPVPAAVRLAWVRGADADTCPDGAWLRREVARRLRRDLTCRALQRPAGRTRRRVR